jgi:hypothetical protein
LTAANLTNLFGLRRSMSNYSFYISQRILHTPSHIAHFHHKALIHIANSFNTAAIANITPIIAAATHKITPTPNIAK